MSSFTKVKMILLAFCLITIAGSQLYLKGIDDGIARVDQESFDSYVHFTKQLHHEQHRHSAKTDVFARAGF